MASLCEITRVPLPSQEGASFVRRFGFPLLLASFLATGVLHAGVPKPSDFIKPGLLGGVAAAVGQFRPVQGADGKTYIEGLQGLVRQEVRQNEDGSWEQVGSLDTFLPCAQIIHNHVTRKRTR